MSATEQRPLIWSTASLAEAVNVEAYTVRRAVARAAELGHITDRRIANRARYVHEADVPAVIEILRGWGYEVQAPARGLADGTAATWDRAIRHTGKPPRPAANGTNGNGAE
jgi:hypothetical protein